MNQVSDLTYNITVVGSGYVGMSLAVLLSRYHKVTLLDIDERKVDLINNKKSPIKDKEIELFLKEEKLNLTGTHNSSKAYENADFVVVATPTDFDEDLGKLNTDIVDEVIADVILHSPNSFIIIKSTLPIGYTHSLQKKHNSRNIIFSPEFLREGMALYDNLYPSRIVIGGQCKDSKIFANILCNSSNKKNIKTFFTSSSEAESIKLFSNAYLAMRVSFFNELDSFALSRDLNPENIINGVSSDSRIGADYNNPSFGYGGYCLPKDTKQLIHDFGEVPNPLIKSLKNSNDQRKTFMVDSILKVAPQVVGIFRLIMKKGSDNFRFSAIQDIIIQLKSKVEIIIYEPFLTTEDFHGHKVITDLEEFKSKSDIIILNRKSSELKDVEQKCFTRDIYGEN